ncbi:MAG: hypothetical protein PHW62_00925 [Candidatus Ratteibacteria bacterium]|nr:hypothetical protein [Candidatus Ratteibacteria bacterium]
MEKKRTLKSAEELAEEEISKHTGINIEEVHAFMNYEEYAVEFVKAHLRTPEQKKWLDEQDLSILDVFHGSFGAVAGQEEYIEQMLNDWNKKLGRKHFGF